MCKELLDLERSTELTKFTLYLALMSEIQRAWFEYLKSEYIVL